MHQYLWMLASGAGTTLGALILIFWKNPPKSISIALSGSAGVMLAATMIGLIPAALDYHNYLLVVIGISVGVVGMAFLDKNIPHLHPSFKEEPSSSLTNMSLGASMLIIIAITLHNIPEGMAVGISFSEGQTIGVPLAIAMLIHNIPEGLVVALPLLAMNVKLPKVIFWTTLTGLLEVIAAFAAYWLGSGIESIVPFGLAFAAGAMLYVVIDEMIPAAHLESGQKSSIIFLFSFIFMMSLMQLLS